MNDFQSIARGISLFLFAFTLMFAGLAVAAEISPSANKVNGNPRGLVWENVDIDGGDTVTNGFWTGGCGTIEYDSAGSWTTGTSEINFSFVSGNEKSWDSDDAPDGLKFSSATGAGVLVYLPAGYVLPTYASSGGYAEHDIYMIPINEADGC